MRPKVKVTSNTQIKSNTGNIVFAGNMDHRGHLALQEWVKLYSSHVHTGRFIDTKMSTGVPK